MRRFRWTRTKYQHAHHLARLLGRIDHPMPDEPPTLLRRYWDLWERHPSYGDPLRKPLSWRYDPTIPF